MTYVEGLTRAHDRKGFSSGVPALDSYLKHHALQNEKRGLSRTFVLIEEGRPVILGYFSLSMSHVSIDGLTDAQRRGLPRYPVPTVLLARLATDERQRGRGYGRRLLVEALERGYEASRSVGAMAVEAHAKDEEAVGFYKKYGFVELVADRHLWLPMSVVAELVQRAPPRG